ncbi:6-phosphogluconolactonase SCDLUD_004808 [Saccharomycodes ludwigii]|uniref:6-phosphogluconolactonase n=1 Tax=Saccharomycodes ludwigii TaxID=36035 RepID=UPI001E8356E4|nr:hypothetical protein SCDLUD_004808 [Saccharomycodes ludwigii]KAH3899367.1 hypothetical protein SCDLUD_004808 [Saccharomycodes ludwigii]
MSPVLHKFPTVSELTKNFINQLIIVQNKAIEERGKFIIGLSGGSIINVLHALVQPEFHGLIHWSKWLIFFCDERLVPLDDLTNSTYAQFKEKVLDNLKTEEGPVVYTINENLISFQEYDKIAQEYETLIVDNVINNNKFTGAHGKFDLLLLGCGPDGHTCSIFPGETHKYLIDNKDDKYVLYCHDSPKPPPNRITMTFKTLGSTHHIWFIAMGSSKVDILKDIFISKNTNLPCVKVNQSFNNIVEWFVDESSVKGLPL